MNSLEIYSNTENNKDLLERWVLQGTEAKLTYLKNSFEPMYEHIEGVTPYQGEKYLKLLHQKIDNSSYLKAVLA